MNRFWLHVKFWHLMVGVGLVLVLIGLVLILVPNQVGGEGSILIEVFGAKFEGSEIGLALIVLGLACFLIGQKDRADQQKYQSIKEDLKKNSRITARLVNSNLQQTMDSAPDGRGERIAREVVDLDDYRQELHRLMEQSLEDWEEPHAIRIAERGMEMLEALEREGYSFKIR